MAVLEQRREQRDAAREAVHAAELDPAVDAARLALLRRRHAVVTREHIDEARELIGLLGMPIVLAPAECEAQCASLCERGLVATVASEDMDTLAFGSPRVLRNLLAPPSRQQDIFEIELATALHELGLSRTQFVDLCILLGSDYMPSIDGARAVLACMHADGRAHAQASVT